MRMLLAGLAGELDRLAAVEVDSLSASELHDLVVGLQSRSSRLDAVKARLTAAWDARRTWADNGSRSAAARLARDAPLARAEADVQVRRARKLRAMPATA